MEWNDNCISLFIQQIQMHKCLWDPRDKYKKNRLKVHAAFTRIAEEMGAENIDELKRKKEILFQTYRNYRRKVSHSQKAGAEAEGIYKPSWPPYSLLDTFLRPIYTPKITLNTLDTLDDNEELRKDNGEAPDDDNETSRTDCDENKEPEELANIDENLLEKHEPAQQPTKRSYVKSARKEHDRAEAAFNELLAIKDQIAKRNANSVGKDMCSVYADLLAMKLRKMDPRMQCLAMHKIDNIIFDLTFDSVMLPSPRSGSSCSSSIEDTIQTDNYQYINLTSNDSQGVAKHKAHWSHCQ